jgi:glycogen(starch) synthase
MRIAIVASAYRPWVGGVEVLTERLAHQFLAAGHAVEVWTIRHPEDLPEREMLDGIVVRRFVLPIPPAEARALLTFPLPGASALRALLKATREFRPDVLHVQCFSTNGVYALAVAEITRRPLIVTLQGETVMDADDIYDESTLMRWALRAAMRRAAAVTGCSAFVVRDAVERFGLRPGRGVVIHNGIDNAEEDDGDPVDLPAARFVLGLGRLVAKKGFDLLIEAWAQVAPDFPDVGLVIAGGGVEADALQALATRLGVAGSVHFPGMLSQRNVRWLMAQAEVFVLPSRVEPFGIVVLEALRAGTPAVVSSRGGAGEIIDDGQALLVDPTDTAALAGSISSILADPSPCEPLASARRLRAGAFGWDSIAPRYLSLYESVLHARGARRPRVETGAVR